VRSRQPQSPWTLLLSICPSFSRRSTLLRLPPLVPLEMLGVQRHWILRLIKRRCEKRHFLRHLYIKTIILPRQARDKHRKNSKKE
jgi:hypothetical protein